MKRGLSQDRSSRTRKPSRPLSELESCVLALIGAKGPCSAYVIRREFLDSLSPQWSGTAGSIYPLVERLQKRGFIKAKAHEQGRRKSELLTLTAAGKRQAHSWIAAPFEDWVTGVPPDPVRTRVSFLPLLPLASQRTFVAAALEGVQRNLAEVAADVAQRKAKGGAEYLASRGALLAMEARQKWLREVRDSLR